MRNFNEILRKEIQILNNRNEINFVVGEWFEMKMPQTSTKA